MVKIIEIFSLLSWNHGGAVLFAFLAGFLPVILWLLFWLQEDRKRPEPKRLIFKTFVVGGFFIAIAFCLERFVTPDSNIIPRLLQVFNNGGHNWQIYLAGLWPIVAWAFIEEFVKFAAAHVAALKSPDNDEPIDAMVYLVTAALGFAAVENFLFLLASAGESGSLTASFLFTGNLRFLGATLLHVVSSATLGAFIGYSFYKSLKMRTLFAALGLITATLLHALFNLFIIIDEGKIF